MDVGCSFVGMATKYAEGLLAIKYRECDEKGEMCGGPYVLYRKGTGNKLLAKLFAFFGVAVALLGIGTFGQVKSIADAVTISFNIPPWDYSSYNYSFSCCCYFRRNSKNI